ADNGASSQERDDDPNPIGTSYKKRLEDAIDKDREADSEGIWQREVAEALEVLNRTEAVQEYVEVARRGRLLCFCSALGSLERTERPEAATGALNARHRRSLSGNSIALFFRARALLISSAISIAQTQLGLQFVTAALANYDRNPGMYHTKALLLFRMSLL